jgi:hypothetical protein
VKKFSPSHTDSCFCLFALRSPWTCVNPSLHGSAFALCELDHRNLPSKPLCC